MKFDRLRGIGIALAGEIRTRGAIFRWRVYLSGRCFKPGSATAPLKLGGYYNPLLECLRGFAFLKADFTSLLNFPMSAFFNSFLSRSSSFLVASVTRVIATPIH
jgi:hypothetical protein